MGREDYRAERFPAEATDQSKAEMTERVGGLGIGHS